MNYWAHLFLFFLGASFGSFLDVLVMRYREDKFILSRDIILGRSKCSHCHKKLKWYELIPVLSFVIQLGRCRNCKQRLSWEYILIEVLCGLIFVFVPIYFKNHFIVFFSKTTSNLIYFWSVVLIWDLILLALVLISLIDFKLKIIPNETVIFLLILGVILNILISLNWNNFYSFLGAYRGVFPEINDLWKNKLISSGLALLFFGGIVGVTLGRGMGIGDVKLMIVLGFIFGWPEVLLITILSFIIGGVWGLLLIFIRGVSRKHMLPFGPFIVLSSFLVFFVGENIISLYFNIASKIFSF